MGEAGPGHEFAFRGGVPCLDFTNTLAWSTSDTPVEHLGSYRALVDWSGQAALLPPEAPVALAGHAIAMPDVAEEVLARAIALREAIRGLMSASVAREAAGETALAVLNEELSRALSRSRMKQVSPGAYGWTWSWQGDGGELELDCPLWPVARSAAELLTSPALGRVKICQGPGCGWMFLDQSRNGSRRWCDSRDCGNRERVRRHYARRRADGR